LQQALELCKEQIGVLLHGERAVATGVWGKVRPQHYLLREGDRIEFYRPLQADPKQARRARIGDRAKRG
jgi:putative ubiquitin-RnfH superfamily antitoxin RatB of RatAB toxin-antitoxin module